MKLRPGARILYCCHPGCSIGWSVENIVPKICPNCGKSARWTTSLAPRVPWLLSIADLSFLKVNRIWPS